MFLTHVSQLNLVKGASPAAAPTNLTAQDLVNVTNAVWEKVADGKEMQELMRGFAAVLLGKVEGFDENLPAFQAVNDSKIRVKYRVDERGNRIKQLVLDLD